MMINYENLLESLDFVIYYDTKVGKKQSLPGVSTPRRSDLLIFIHQLSPLPQKKNKKILI